MDADTRGWIKAYADGVNFWLAGNELPPEYGALELSRAAPWDPVDTVVIGKALAFQLSFDLDIEQTLKFAAYQQAGAAAGFDGAALFFGDTHRIAPADNRVSVPGFLGIGAAMQTEKSGAAATLASAEDPVHVLLGQAANAEISIDASTIALAQGLRDKWRGLPLFERAFDRKESPIGSNLWAVAGEHTASGKALVANDPHLSLGLPSIFVEHHIHSTDPRHAEPMDAVGASLPGAPGIIHGCNQRICWGTTTNSMDVTDVFQEQFLVNNLGLPYASVHNDGTEPVQWLFQSYYVNQLGDGELDSIQRSNAIGYTNGGVTIVVPRRNDGPVVQIDGNQGLSVAYAGWGATRELESFRLINRAGNLAQFQEALSYFDFGSQNFVYGDTEGNIAYFVTGEAPIRKDLQAGAPAGGCRRGSSAAAPACMTGCRCRSANATRHWPSRSCLRRRCRMWSIRPPAMSPMPTTTRWAIRWTTMRSTRPAPMAASGTWTTAAPRPTARAGSTASCKSSSPVAMSPWTT